MMIYQLLHRQRVEMIEEHNLSEGYKSINWGHSRRVTRLGRRPWLRKHEAKANAAVMRPRLNSISPPHATVQIPVMMAAATEPPFRAWTGVWPSVTRDGFEFINAHILAPFPHIARHVEQSELIGRLGSNRMRSRAAWQYLPSTVCQTPSSPPAKHIH